ncbi:hypothetical protein U9M48_016597 [Paspalum notatum var. saurae]|uniref:Protein LURP-one-related 11 n=1 Tax=Paspalum notatum var. saurae TaxID=547442 RepID=A0AAQ3T7E4_PASNO
MNKIKPLTAAPSSSAASSSEDGRQSSLGEQKQQAVYTVWMKSLVFNGNGCTVYGADGCVAYRVDNYACRGGREVFFMDHAGNNLIRIQRKSFCCMLRRWEAHRCCFDDDGEETTRPWFRARKAWKNGGAVVTMLGGSERTTYRIEGCSRKSDYRITGADGAVAAAIGRKQTASGVVLGEDVLTLTVGSGTDHLLVLGLVVVRGLMDRCL